MTRNRHTAAKRLRENLKSDKRESKALDRERTWQDKAAERERRAAEREANQ